jgi:hypothetical protein
MAMSLLAKIVQASILPVSQVLFVIAFVPVAILAWWQWVLLCVLPFYGWFLIATAGPWSENHSRWDADSVDWGLDDEVVTFPQD